MKVNVRINTPVVIMACQSWEDHTPAAAVLGWTLKATQKSYGSGIAIDINPATAMVFPSGFAERIGQGNEAGRIHICTTNPCTTHRRSESRRAVHAVAVGFVLSDPTKANELMPNVLRWAILADLGQASLG